MGDHNNSHRFDKLKGRENYDTWKVSAKSYLVIKKLWKHVESESTSADDDLMARSELNLMVEPVNYSFITNAETANAAWKSLENAFSDTGAMRKVALLQTLATLKLSECENMSDYVSKKINLWEKVKKAGWKIDDATVGGLLLGGLPDEYRPMIMAIENNGSTMTADSVKNVLLQDISFDVPSNEQSAMYGKNNFKKSKNFKKKVKCYNCGEYGHVMKHCKKPRESEKDRNSTSGERDNVLFSSLIAKGTCDEWFIDSGASAHMTMKRNILCNIKSNSGKVTVANNAKMEIECSGDVHMKFKDNMNITMKNVLYVPELCTNLVSVSQMIRNGNKVVFEDKRCVISNESGDIIATATLIDDMFKLDCSLFTIKKNENMVTAQMKKTLFTAQSTAVPIESNIWHRRLGHVAMDKLNRMQHVAHGINVNNCKVNERCITCAKGKQTRSSFIRKTEKSSNLLEIVHSDLCGPMSTASLGGARYYVSFIDDYSRMLFVYPIRDKSQALAKFIEFRNFVEKQTGSAIKILRTDNGGEFCNNAFDEKLRQYGILHQKTAPYTPEQNGVAERFNRTIVEKSRCMLIDANLSKRFWAEAVCTATHIINRLPCRSNNGKTPYELWTGTKPDLTNMKIFGCTAMVHIPKQKRRKLDEKSTQCIFMGYSAESKAYRVYDMTTRKLIISRDVIFVESNERQQVNDMIANNSNYVYLPAVTEENQPNESFEINSPDGPSSTSNTDDMCDTNNAESEAALVEDDNNINPDVTVDESFVDADESISTLENSASNTNGDNNATILEISSDDDDDEQQFNASMAAEKFIHVRRKNIAADIPIEPESPAEALQRSDSTEWKKAMQCEYNSLIENRTWKLVDIPEGKRPIDCRWVFKIKKNTDQNIITYKARLVVRGFSQQRGIDYQETYSPVVKYSSIRFLIAVAARKKLRIRQLDAVTAFLNGELHEDIYMLQPECFNDGSGRVCKLQKSLYGLKQASRAWNQKLNGVLIDCGLRRSEADPCIYFSIEGEDILVLAVYVDDILIFSNNIVRESKLVEQLKSHFKMKDLGEASSVLGVTITRDSEKNTIAIDQQNYISKVIEKFGMKDCNPISTPLDPNQKLSSQMSPSTDAEKEEMRDVPYQEAIGSLMYAAQLTRPDICFPLCLLSRFNKNPGKPHWQAVKRVLRYLAATNNRKLVYRGKDENNTMLGFSDADYGGDLDSGRSTTGYAFVLQGAAVSWCAKTQKSVSISTCESELQALTSTIQEAVWLKRLENEVFSDAPNTITILCDNKSTLHVLINNSASQRLKHVRIRANFIGEKIDSGLIKLKYISTNDMLADIFTKPMSSDRQNKFSSLLGLRIK